MRRFVISLFLMPVVLTFAKLIQPRNDGCTSFTQVGEFFNTTGKPVPWDYNYVLCPSNLTLNPEERNCVYQEDRGLDITPTLNISTSLNSSSILSLISNETAYPFEFYYGYMDPTTLGYGDLTIPSGHLGWPQMVPTITCVNGTLGGCSSDFTGSETIEVQACQVIPISTEDEEHRFYNISGTLELVLIPGNKSELLGEYISTATLSPVRVESPTSTPTPDGGASHLGAGLPVCYVMLLLSMIIFT